MDGYEQLDWLSCRRSERQQEGTVHVPIILLQPSCEVYLFLLLNNLLLNLQSDCDHWLRRKRHFLDAFKVPRHMGWWDPYFSSLVSHKLQCGPDFTNLSVYQKRKKKNYISKRIFTKFGIASLSLFFYVFCFENEQWQNPV